MARSRRKASSTRGKMRVNPRGVISVHPQGYAFVQTSEGEFFIPRSALGGAFDGDVVEVRRRTSHVDRNTVTSLTSRRPEGRVVRVVERAHEYIFGIFTQEETFGVVVSENPGVQYDFIVHPTQTKGAKTGDLVRLEVINFPAKATIPTGRICDIISDNATLYTTEALLDRYYIRESFSKEALAEANAQDTSIEHALIHEGYRDIRTRPVITIDPTDAKDFDDALSFERIDEHIMRVGIHIADVSAYVAWGGPLQQEAQERSCSVYLPDRVVPMLPERLSNTICSLQPHVERRCITVDITVDEAGTILATDIYPAIMKSLARCTYDNVQAIFEQNAHGEVDETQLDGLVSYMPFSELKDLLFNLRRVARLWDDTRKKRGALEFVTQEPRAVVDAQGNVCGYVIHRKNDATKLVESCMITANEVVAIYIHEALDEGVYRIHAAPEAFRFAEMADIFAALGIVGTHQKKRIAYGEISALQSALFACETKGSGALIAHSLIIRLMKRALYTQKIDNHFGLGSTCYTHFTSPIRRYPDLLVHYILKALLRNKQHLARTYIHESSFALEYANEMERKADKISREAHEIKLFELLATGDRNRYTAIVSVILPSGFMALLPLGIEVFVSLAHSSEYFFADELGISLTGTHSMKRFVLGDTVEVQIEHVMPRLRQAQAILIE